MTSANVISHLCRQWLSNSQRHLQLLSLELHLTSLCHSRLRALLSKQVHSSYAVVSSRLCHAHALLIGGTQGAYTNPTVAVPEQLFLWRPIWCR